MGSRVSRSTSRTSAEQALALAGDVDEDARRCYTARFVGPARSSSRAVKMFDIPRSVISAKVRLALR